MILMLRIDWPVLIFSSPKRNDERERHDGVGVERKRNRGTTYPVSPIAGVIAVSFTVEFLHHGDGWLIDEVALVTVDAGIPASYKDFIDQKIDDFVYTCAFIHINLFSTTAIKYLLPVCHVKTR